MRARTKLAVASLVSLLLMGPVPTVGDAETSSEITYCCEETARSIPPIEMPTRRPDRKHGLKEQRSKDGRHVPQAVDDASPEVEEASPGHRRGSPDRHLSESDRKKNPADRQSISGNRPVSYSPLPEVSRRDPAGNSEEGSTPVVPILIAVSLLAALSIGIAFYRERIRPRRG